MKNPDCIRRKIRYRKSWGINIEEVIEDLQSSQHLSKYDGSVDELVEAYRKSVQISINHNAPSGSNITTLRSEAPWYSDKKIRKKAERTLHLISLMMHFDIYKDLVEK